MLDSAWQHVLLLPGIKVMSLQLPWYQTTGCAGFGLDFVWPYLADYPEGKVAVIDDTCVMRPTHILGPSPLTKVLLCPACNIHIALRRMLCGADRAPLPPPCNTML